MLIVSREMGSRPLGVILTVRREVFIWGLTEVMVPWRIVPREQWCEWWVCVVQVRRSSASDNDRRDSKGTNAKRTILQFDSHCLIGTFHQESRFDVLVLLFLGNGGAST